MIFDFDKMEVETFPHFKGGEKEVSAKMFFDGKVRIMNGKLIPGATIGLHTHETSSEIIFMISGHAKVLMDGKYEEISAGQCHYCPKGHTHSFINDGEEDVIIYAVVPEQ